MNQPRMLSSLEVAARVTSQAFSGSVPWRNGLTYDAFVESLKYLRSLCHRNGRAHEQATN